MSQNIQLEVVCNLFSLKQNTQFRSHSHESCYRAKPPSHMAPANAASLILSFFLFIQLTTSAT